MCLWGTSFAGGHVLAVARDTPGITAIVSQVRLARQQQQQQQALAVGAMAAEALLLAAAFNRVAHTAHHATSRCRSGALLLLYAGQPGMCLQEQLALPC
jgi:hypothetical protein